MQCEVPALYIRTTQWLPVHNIRASARPLRDEVTWLGALYIYINIHIYIYAHAWNTSTRILVCVHIHTWCWHGNQWIYECITVTALLYISTASLCACIILTCAYTWINSPRNSSMCCVKNWIACGCKRRNYRSNYSLRRRMHACKGMFMCVRMYTLWKHDEDLYTNVYVCMHVVSTRIYIYTYILIYIYIYILYVHSILYVHPYWYIYIYIHNTYIQTYWYTSTYMYMYTYMHTRMHMKLEKKNWNFTQPPRDRRTKTKQVTI